MQLRLEWKGWRFIRKVGGRAVSSEAAPVAESKLLAARELRIKNGKPGTFGNMTERLVRTYEDLEALPRVAGRRVLAGGNVNPRRRSDARPPESARHSSRQCGIACDADPGESVNIGRHSGPPLAVRHGPSPQKRKGPRRQGGKRRERRARSLGPQWLGFQPPRDKTFRWRLSRGSSRPNQKRSSRSAAKASVIDPGIVASASRTSS